MRRGRFLRGSDIYQLLGGGTAYGSARIGMSLTMSHETEFFGGNPLCHFHATVDGGLNGPWSLDCQGPNTPFVVADTLTHIPCDLVLQRNAESQPRLAGEAR